MVSQFACIRLPFLFIGQPVLLSRGAKIERREHITEQRGFNKRHHWALLHEILDAFFGFFFGNTTYSVFNAPLLSPPPLWEEEMNSLGASQWTWKRITAKRVLILFFGHEVGSREGCQRSSIQNPKNRKLVQQKTAQKFGITYIYIFLFFFSI